MVSVPVGDVFAQIYDALVPIGAGAQTLEDWSRSPEYAKARDWVRDQVRVADGQAVLDTAGFTVTDPASRLGVLAGIDTLLAVAASTSPAAGSVAVTALRVQYSRCGRFNVAEAGMVVPRRVHRGRDNVRSDTFDQELNTLRISEEAAARCLWVRVDRATDHLPGMLELRIGQVPLASAADVQRREVETAGGHPAYELRPDPGLRSRIPAGVKALAGAGVDLGITAEITLDTEGVDVWRTSLGVGGPTWLLAGTGPVEMSSAPGLSAPASTEPFKDGSDVPVNRAVILHGRTGHVIAVADKLRGYCIASGDLALYGLPAGAQNRDEGIRHGTKLVILESNAGRFSVLVCEDLDRLLEWGPVLREVGVSHVLNPVVAPELQEYRWQHQDGRTLYKDAGSRQITANSLAVQRLNRTGDAVPTLLVVDGSRTPAAQLVSNPAAPVQTDEVDAVVVRHATVSAAPLP